jgi:hypothetical protein
MQSDIASAEIDFVLLNASSPAPASVSLQSEHPEADVTSGTVTSVSSVSSGSGSSTKKRFLSAAFKAARFVSKPAEEELEAGVEAPSSNEHVEEVQEGAVIGAPTAVGASTRAKRFVLSRLAGSSKGRDAVLSKAMSSEKQAAFKAIVGAVNQCKLTCVLLCRS